MTYDFDQILDRTQTASLKWSFRKEMCGNTDAIPMWVADMDFACPQEVVRAVSERARHPVYGYSMRTEGYYNSLISWMLRRNNWAIQQEWVCFAPGIVPALNIAVLAYTKPGDAIIVQPPVYYPFFNAVRNNGRRLVENPLKWVDGRYVMDFEDLEAKAAGSARLLILSSPHNPVGRVWMPEELRELAGICLRHGIVILSDEIHSDIIMSGSVHTCIASLSPEIAAISLTCTAPNKTFNLAGIPTGNIIIPDSELRSAFAKQTQALGLGLGNIFGMAALEAAYTHGENWLKGLNAYVGSNFGILSDFVRGHSDRLSLAPMEGSYLAWIDCRKLGLPDPELKSFFTDTAGVWLDEGSKFGTGGSGRMRMNLACPAATLRSALARIDSALANLHPSPPA